MESYNLINTIRYDPTVVPAAAARAPEQAVEQRQSPRFPAVSSVNGSSPNSNEYAQVQRDLNDEILNFQLQPVARATHSTEEQTNLNENAANHQRQAAPLLFGSDINPSVGDASDRESELNIRQLESSVSTISDIASPTSPPTTHRIAPVKHNGRQNLPPLTSEETDF